jgi:hypothetical protein
MNNAGKGSPQLKALVIDLDDTLYRCAEGCSASLCLPASALPFDVLTALFYRNEAIPEAVRNAIQGGPVCLGISIIG